ncbi:MAG: DNA methyltransferase, partial [Desulfobaccales bacterium]
MQNLLQDLVKLLEQDDRLVVEGQLLKNKIVELALGMDSGLIRLLLSNEGIRRHFFAKVDAVLVFDKIKFQQFVSNKEFLPDSYTAFKNKIGLTMESHYLTDSKEVLLAWPYKDCVLEGGQAREDAKRNEVFWNETLAPDQIDRLLSPKVLTAFKKYDKNGEHKVTDITLEDSLLIKGNNLLSLHTLRKVYAGKIKLIYIDPPFNTPGDGNTFMYNNSFNHSSWLTFIKNRVEVAKDLLKSDGVLAVAIDDEEQAYLAILCDEIFGRENHMGTLIIQSKASGRTTDTYFATSHEYVLFYSKEQNMPEINFFELPEEQKKKYKEGEGENSFKWRDFLRTGGYSTPEERRKSYYPIYFNPEINNISLKQESNNYLEILPIDSDGKKRVWRKTPKSFMQHVEKGEIKITKNKQGGWKVNIIDKIKKGVRPKSVWVGSKYDASAHGTKLLKAIFEGEKVFSFPKSLYAVKDIIEIFTEKAGNDIVLDFFAGSGTTAQALLELNTQDEGNRKFILCEQMHYVQTVTRNRVHQVIKNNGAGSFVYCELMQANQIFVDLIQDAENSKALQTIWNEMQEKAFLSSRADSKTIDTASTDFMALNLDDQKRFLIEVLDKNMLY